MYFNRDNRKLTFAAGALALGVLVGAAYLEKKPTTDVVVGSDGKSRAVEQPGASKRLLVVEVDASASGADQRRLLDQRLQTIVAAAKHRRAGVEVWAIDDATNVHREPLATAAFDPGVDNPNAPLPAGTAQRFVDDVTRAIDARKLSNGTDMPGALVLLTDRRRQAGRGVEVHGLLITDGISSVPKCDFGLVPLEESTFEATARACLAEQNVALGGMTVYLAAVGQDTSGAEDVNVLGAAPRLLEHLVTVGGGKPRAVNLDVPNGGFAA
ncbi:MAG TPA: hypothetical protein VFB78_07615 [Acidimicrobiales bacterium]|nr:hypothetical protein [Acidimicrobiales bacterium]